MITNQALYQLSYSSIAGGRDYNATPPDAPPGTGAGILSP